MANIYPQTLLTFFETFDPSNQSDMTMTNLPHLIHQTHLIYLTFLIAPFILLPTPSGWDKHGKRQWRKGVQIDSTYFLKGGYEQ